MSAQTLIVLGSGPGIGISVAKLFAQKHFSKIALVSRNTERLQSDKEEVAAAAKDAGKTAQVAVYTTDLNDFDALRKTLNEIEKLGIGAVFYNAARIRPSDILTMSVEELEEDFRTTTAALYVTAQWAIPLLRKAAGGNLKPSFLVTSSFLPETPLPFLLSLSAVKASQQSIVLNLNEAFGKDIHFGLIKVNGEVSTDAKKLNPTNIANRVVEFYERQTDKEIFCQINAE